ncbi:MAG: HAMP domain-containing sensor histidine kinase [Steroidobacteraceae bacterium]
MSSSISRQLVLWLAVPLMLLALCGALVHYFNNVAPGMIASDRRLKSATNAFMARLVVDRRTVSLDAAADGKPALAPANSVDFSVRDQTGKLLLGDEHIPAVAIADAAAQMSAVLQLEGRSLRALTTRFDTSAGILIVTAVDLAGGSEPAARYGLMSTLLWDFVQLDITLVLVWFGIQLGLRPMKKLREEIARRSALDLRPIDESSVPREIAPVVVTLNRLFQMLRTSVQSQQQFIANTAHQLRTPITGMQAQLDILAAEPAAAPIKNRVATLQEAIRQLAHSANQLLTLARADPAINVVSKNQRVSLKTIAEEVIAKFFDRALLARIDLGAEVQPATLEADPSLLDDMLSNLVDNALKYTPAGGTVTVITGERGAKAFIAVEDSGPGIPESERERVKQRFYRLPNSPGHGSGLGLAIVAEIAGLYGASLVIESGAGGVGTRVSLQFT